MEFIHPFLDGLYMGVLSAFSPLTILVYCLYFSIKKNKNIGKVLFTGHFFITFLVVVLSFFGFDTFLHYEVTYFIMNCCSAALCILFSVSLMKKVISNRSEEYYIQDNPDTDNDIGYEDIYSLQDTQEGREQEYENSDGLMAPFLAGVLFTLFSQEAINWASISIRGSIVKFYVVAGGNFTGIVATVLFVVAFTVSQIIIYIIVSKLSLLLGNLIKRILARPFTAIISLLFAFFAILHIISLFQ